MLNPTPGEYVVSVIIPRGPEPAIHTSIAGRMRNWANDPTKCLSGWVGVQIEEIADLAVYSFLREHAKDVAAVMGRAAAEPATVDKRLSRRDAIELMRQDLSRFCEGEAEVFDIIGRLELGICSVDGLLVDFPALELSISIGFTNTRLQGEAAGRVAELVNEMVGEMEGACLIRLNTRMQ